MKCANLILSLLVSLYLSDTAASAQQVQAMKLLTAQVGWALSGQHLYWTADDGTHWKDVTPQESPEEIIGGVFFLDTSHGWAVLSRSDGKGERQFRIASTGDAGQTWSVSHVNLPWKRYAEDFAGGADIFFLDRLNGWTNLELSHSSSLAPALFLATHDGGKTWAATPGAPGRAGFLCFFTETDGLLAGGPQNTELWVTHDGSKTWQQMELKAPPATSPANFPTYGEALCNSGKGGFLPVTYSGPDRSQSALVLFGTNDGGETWKPERTAPHLDETSPGQIAPAAVVDSILIAVTKSGGAAVLTFFAPDGGIRRTSAGPVRDAFSLSFVDSLRGWASSRVGIFSTVDGGASWSDITPPSGHAISPRPGQPKRKPTGMAPGLRSPASSATAGETRARANGVGRLTEAHLGFDTGAGPVQQPNEYVVEL